MTSTTHASLNAVTLFLPRLLKTNSRNGHRRNLAPRPFSTTWNKCGETSRINAPQSVKPREEPPMLSLFHRIQWTKWPRKKEGTKGPFILKPHGRTTHGGWLSTHLSLAASGERGARGQWQKGRMPFSRLEVACGLGRACRVRLDDGLTFWEKRWQGWLHEWLSCEGLFNALSQFTVLWMWCSANVITGIDRT